MKSGFSIFAVLLMFPLFAQAQGNDTSGVDILASILEHCGLDKSAQFLSGVLFAGSAIAGFDYEPLLGCSDTSRIKVLSERLRQVGKPESGGDNNVGPLFSACTDKARSSFYQSLAFGNGSLEGLRADLVEKCGAADLHRFLSMFGSSGLRMADFKKDCRWSKAGPKHARGFWCAPHSG